MPIEEVTRYRTSDGEEFSTRAAAETHEAKMEAESALAGIDRAGLLADPLSPRSRAFEKLGGEIAAARRALPNGLLRHRKAKAEIAPEAFVEREKMGEPDPRYDVQLCYADGEGPEAP
jgi:hypothetical protein